MIECMAKYKNQIQIFIATGHHYETSFIVSTRWGYLSNQERSCVYCFGEWGPQRVNFIKYN
ncbi:hypothetical protein ES332_D11G049000v1 [Gossypium tomentosum]|uniref:Uncharacterized protein n=1 Tax=Gossypium tomentosum TaxID=34277 RepID=A0A5D2II06_GOSTO|nr:hypothetical protein ES332_D11G049000v1 [Gossypium tomentosum]